MFDITFQVTVDYASFKMLIPRVFLFGQMEDISYLFSTNPSLHEEGLFHTAVPSQCCCICAA
jgi:hypothetical protein